MEEMKERKYQIEEEEDEDRIDRESRRKKRVCYVFCFLLLLMIPFLTYESGRIKNTYVKQDKKDGDSKHSKSKSEIESNRLNDIGNNKAEDSNEIDGYSSSSLGNSKRKRYYPLSDGTSPFVNYSEPYIDANSTVELKQKGYKFVGKTGFIDIDYLPDIPLGKCKPKNCSHPIHFLGEKHIWKQAVALASYPGSGNTWARWLLQQGTRLWTASVFCDHTIRSDGYEGECNFQSDIVYK